MKSCEQLDPSPKCTEAPTLQLSNENGGPLPLNLVPSSSYPKYLPAPHLTSLQSMNCAIRFCFTVTRSLPKSGQGAPDFTSQHAPGAIQSSLESLKLFQSDHKTPYKQAHPPTYLQQQQKRNSCLHLRQMENSSSGRSFQTDPTLQSSICT
jgi:hypothetical protein